MIAVVLAVLLFRPSTAKHEQVWTGTVLGGPTIAYAPDPSPDGSKVAFQAVVNGQSQLALMDPKSGDWTLLTHDRDAGSVMNLSWSNDTRIFFDRIGTVNRVFSIPAVGGEPRLILENASGPEVLPNGDMIIGRVNANRAFQLHLFKPNTMEVKPLSALPNFFISSYSALPSGSGVAFFGKPADSPNAANHLYILDLATNQARPFGPELDPATMQLIFGMDVDPVNNALLIDKDNGDSHQILSIPLDGKGSERVLLTLTQHSWFLNVASDGTLYMDQVARPMQILRFKESDAMAQPLATIEGPFGVNASAMQLPDGRFLATGLFDGHLNLLVASSSGEVRRFVESTEETQAPAALVGNDKVAFQIGKAPQQSIAVASIKDGRILQRLKIAATAVLSSLSASTDGSTLFYSDAGSIWSIPAAGGEARKIGLGDSVAFDPRHNDLVVQLNESDGVRLVRMPIGGGETSPIRTPAGVAFSSGQPLGPGAVGRDGRILISGTTLDSWFYPVNVIDPDAGTVRRLPLRYDGDVLSLSWNQSGELVTGASLMRSSIWRFRQQPR